LYQGVKAIARPPHRILTNILPQSAENANKARELFFASARHSKRKEHFPMGAIVLTKGGFCAMIFSG
jgi:hypothetical protein